MEMQIEFIGFGANTLQTMAYAILRIRKFEKDPHVRAIIVRTHGNALGESKVNIFTNKITEWFPLTGAKWVKDIKEIYGDEAEISLSSGSIRRGDTDPTFTVKITTYDRDTNEADINYSQCCVKARRFALGSLLIKGVIERHHEDNPPVESHKVPQQYIR